MRSKSTIYTLLALSIVMLVSLVFNNSPYAPEYKKVQGVQTESTASADTLKVLKVVDGDTVELSNGEKIRLIGINTPEKGQPYFKDAKDTLEMLILEKEVRLELDVSQKDMYGRTLGYLFIGDQFINQNMIESGYAMVDTVPPNVLYADTLVASLDRAKNECKGMWDGLCNPTASSCVQISKINKEGKTKNEEWIEFINTCVTSQDISGYLIKDASASNSFEFNVASISAKGTLRLHSGCGNNSRTSYYWKCPEPQNFIWNNSSDRAYLFDNSGKLISELGY